MNVFTKPTGRKKLNSNRSEFIDEREPTIFSKGLMTVGGAVAVVGLAVAVFGDSRMDIMGDSWHDVPSTEAKATAMTKYQQSYDLAPPAGKYALQYTAATKVRTPDQYGGNGIAGLTSKNGTSYETIINDGCLADTAYDIDGGRVTGVIRGWSAGEINGDVPTASAEAHVASDNKDVIVIQAGNGQNELRFEGLAESDHLRPADGFTEEVLYTHGCDLGMQKTTQTSDGYDSKSSPWIK